jgi:16S rRNA (adenine1518-N6/adenine1519-N6)-dimethyltransferase
VSAPPRPRKRLGQHFLHDPAVISKILATIDVHADDAVVEIGPGTGALTYPLLERLQRLDVIELDPRLADTLDARAGGERLTVHRADARDFDFGRFAEGRRLRIVGNLPYNVSTPLLFRFLGYRDHILDLHLMLQKEVVTRMAATPGSKDYGRLTVMLAAWTDIEPCFDVGAGAFSPPPKVRSTFVRIRPRSEPKFAVGDEARFAAVVARLFSMRRKTLRRILKGEWSPEELESLGLDPQARPETLEPAEFARLAGAERVE